MLINVRLDLTYKDLKLYNNFFFIISRNTRLDPTYKGLTQFSGDEMKNLFLTGEVGVGKSTILENALEGIGLTIGGYITEKIDEGFYRRFVVKSLYDEAEEYTIIKGDIRDKSKEIYVESFEVGLVSILDKSFKNCDIIVMDELGCAEDEISTFTSKVFQILDSSKLVLGVLKEADCNFLNDIRSRGDVKVISIDIENRDHVIKDIKDILSDFINSPYL